ncbi:hypothetical protein [Luteithermobacter gelatinilyticus]|uniref:hypothetical protein n=1 Tax=Luteithermobacter gelatinilyticus TaxID=2582913 RepID=UPI001105E02E|nr:hypothetical protein [Luteithermobacter gelatinilyticus]|tara:strand:- start:4064 stop:4435 length:372 start_codon:yes stop_codon:yes gene_type:complete
MTQNKKETTEENGIAALEEALEAALVRLERAALDLKGRARKVGPDQAAAGDEQAEYLARLEAENRTLLRTLDKLREEYETLEGEHEKLRDYVRELENRTESADRDLEAVIDRLDRIMADERLH